MPNKQSDQFINYNGDLLPAATPVFTTTNRSFRYGDGFFETLRIFNGKIPFIKDHIERLNLSLQLLRMEPVGTYSAVFFEKEILKLAERNDIFNGRARLTIFRKGKGYYTPEEDHAEFIIETEPLDTDRFILNDKGLTIGICNTYRKDFNILSALKSNNALVYVLAGKLKKERGWDDALILNNAGRVVEATASNVIVYKNNILYTPAFTEGCVAGVMKEIIINIANKMNIDFLPAELELAFVREADEIFLTNSIFGLQWVGKWGEDYYKNDLAKKLVTELNELIK